MKKLLLLAMCVAFISLCAQDLGQHEAAKASDAELAGQKPGWGDDNWCAFEGKDCYKCIDQDYYLANLSACKECSSHGC